jgi:UDP-2,3-diacylglucosamine pyrophosphatase LpxH
VDRGEGLRQVALRDLAAQPDVDLLVFGHSHVPALERAPSQAVYANAGTWLGDSTYLLVRDDQVSLNRYRNGASAETISALSKRVSGS